MIDQTTTTIADPPLWASSAQGYAAVAAAQADAGAALRQVEASLGQQIVDAAWEASQVAATCQAKIERAIVALNNSAVNAVDAAGHKVELATVTIMTAALELAAQHGCTVDQIVTGAQSAPVTPPTVSHAQTMVAPTLSAYTTPQPVYVPTTPASGSPGQIPPSTTDVLEPPSGGYSVPTGGFTTNDIIVPSAPVSIPASGAGASTSSATSTTSAAPPSSWWIIVSTTTGCPLTTQQSPGAPTPPAGYRVAGPYADQSAASQTAQIMAAQCGQGGGSSAELPPPYIPPAPVVAAPGGGAGGGGTTTTTTPHALPRCTVVASDGRSYGGTYMIRKLPDGTCGVVACADYVPVAGEIIYSTYDDLAEAQSKVSAYCGAAKPPCVFRSADPPPPISVPNFEDRKACADALNQSLAGISGSLITWLKSYEWVNSDGCYDFARWIKNITDPLPSPISWVVADILQVGEIVRQAAGQLFTSDAMCNAGNVVPIAILQAILGAASRWIGAGADKPLTRVSRLLDYTCPDGIPGQSEVDALYAHNYIGDEKWTCWTRANNNIPETRANIINMMRTRPSIGQTVELHNRGFFSREESNARIVRQGVETRRDQEAFYELARFIPGAGDVVRFMTRDVFDPAVVTKYRLDTDFDAKFQGDALAYAKANGILPDVMKQYWRAHWKLPSVSEAFQMYLRLRPDRYGPDLAFTEQDLREMFAINDVAPPFVDRLIEVSRPIPRLVDLRNEFNYGVIDQDDAVVKLQDRGLSRDDAAAVAKLWSRQRGLWLAGRGWYKKWVKGLITDAQAAAKATADGCSKDEIADLKDQVSEERTANTVEVCTNALHKRYLIGDVSADQMTRLLLNVGHDTGAAVELVRQWGCERDSRGKLVGASELCEYVSNGLLTIAEYRRRLALLGYGPDDITRVIALCNGKIAQRIAAAQSRADKLAQQAEAKLTQQQAKLQSAAAKATAASYRQKQTAQRDAEKARVAVAKAASVVAQVSGEDFKAVFDFLVGKANTIIQHHGWSFAGSASLMTDLAQGVKAGKVKDWRTYYGEAIGELPPPVNPDLIRAPNLL